MLTFKSMSWQSVDLHFVVVVVLFVICQNYHDKVLNYLTSTYRISQK